MSTESEAKTSEPPETPEQKGPLRYLSGVQPSGQLHLGNYFGAIRPHLANQDNAYYFIANYHALTSTRDPELLAAHVFDVAATYLALGLDPNRATLWLQSDVPEVTELTWLLSTVAGMGLLERAVSYKDKKERGLQASVGLFTYPILQAADILAFDSDVVPVGKDQSQHLEMTRDMATAFNSLFGPTFKLPKTQLGTPVLVPGLDGEKMSKSYDNHIPIMLRGKALKKRVMSIVTDSTPLEDPKEPDGCLPYELYKLIGTEAQIEEMAEKLKAGGYGYGHAKKDLLDAINAHFGEARERYDGYFQRPDEVYDVLAEGAKRAGAVAREVVERARAACGIGRRLKGA